MNVRRMIGLKDPCRATSRNTSSTFHSISGKPGGPPFGPRAVITGHGTVDLIIGVKKPLFNNGSSDGAGFSLSEDDILRIALDIMKQRLEPKEDDE